MDKLKAIFELLKKTFQEWNEHKAPRLGAALAYYTIFSLSPLLIIVISIAGLVFGTQAAQSRIMTQIEGLVGQQGAQLIQSMIQNGYHPSTNILLAVVGVVTLLLGALGVFGQLQDSLNEIWEVEPKPNLGIMGMIKTRLLSFTLLLGTGFLLMVSLVISAGLQAVANFFGNILPFPLPVLELLNFALSFGVITLLFAMIYRVLPDADIDWRDVWIGAAVTALLFVIGKQLIGIYLGRSSVGSAFGAAGALVIVLLWIYYSAQILLFGAEFTRVYADEYGSRVHPSPESLAATDPEHVNPNSAPAQPRHGRQTGAGQPAPAPRPKARGARQEKPVPAPQSATASLARRKMDQLAYQRNLAALFGLLAGAIIEARIIHGGGCADADGHDNGR